MNAFYNDIVPKNLAAILGKLDKAGLRRQIIDHVLTPSDPNAGRGFTIFDLTPKMREEVLKGLPLFSRGVPVTMPTAPPAPYDPSIY